MTLDLHSTPEEVMRAVEALQQFGKQCGVSDRDLFGLALALEESASNIVNHSLKPDSKLTFQVSIEHTGSHIVIELRDRGPQFDPTQPTEPKKTDDDPVGGWGLVLVRRYTDEIHYRREAGENILRLTKRLQKVASPKSLC
jgi:serine/threonine-protein kinase RsbW